MSEPVNVNKVRLYGPALERGVRANVPTHVNVDCRDAGEGAITDPALFRFRKSNCNNASVIPFQGISN